jgi:hypothetical protein
MLNAPEYLGTTEFFYAGENFTRTLHIWAYYEETGELTSIRFGISIDLLCAHYKHSRQACTTPVKRHLWKVAEERLRAGHILDEDNEDSDVIEPFDSNVVFIHGGT